MSESEKIRIISRREFDWLKTFKVLEPEEQKKIDEYEKAKQSQMVVNIPKKEILKTKPESIQKIMITKQLIWKFFKESYKIETGVKFNETTESIKNIEPIIKYFAVDDEFFKCDNLIKTMNQPSFSKGLLIIGKFGNGKTSIMKALGRLFNHYNMPIKFTCVNAHDLVTEWEGISTQGDKTAFFAKYTCKALYIDDVKKERKASNYLVTEVVRDILEKRYDKKLKTFITCNYREEDKVGVLKDAIQEFNRYGNHIYDRVFEMFNIIEFKGKSFR